MPIPAQPPANTNTPPLRRVDMRPPPRPCGCTPCRIILSSGPVIAYCDGECLDAGEAQDDQA